ncbi:Integrase core domain-containing protein [Paracoccus denitrificans]|nr:hypothetical protein PDE01_40940 [Paracoccus denitrificans]SDJ61505.1 Integrase core domain-containing protein [Paracoccus denitrificans]SFR20530.1 Integrase core domain-containing protein [Paracoccus denitrificans]
MPPQPTTQTRFLYLVAIMDWHTRKVLSWRISNTLEADFCVEALTEAIHKFGSPEIMNTDQGSQFTSFAWTDRLRRSGVRISMDGKGRFLDNIFIERLWRTLKYECVYLHAWETGSETKAAIRKWMTFYMGDQTKEKLFDPCAFLRGQCWIETEAAEVGDLAGKQFGMRKVRHVGRL